MTGPSTHETEFRVVSQTFDSWNVQFNIAVAELLDQQGLLTHLRRIKQQIARMHVLPETCLIFDGIVRKTRSEDFVDVVVRIKKAIFEKGNPKVLFREGIGADQAHYSHMSAHLDLFYLDPFEKQIMLDRVWQVIREAGVMTELVDRDLIGRKVKEVLEKQINLKDIPIAKGAFPTIGTDATLDFYFQAVVEAGKTDHYYSSRRVNRGDLLCHKNPSKSEGQGGRNVRGEHLPARAGLDIELRAGNGAELSIDGNEVVAEIEGVAVVDRHMHVVKLVGGTKEIPKFIEVKVNGVLRIEGNQIIDISSSQAVEIIGNLSMGSRILTDCEVYVSGDVEAGAMIQAASDVYIEGDVRGATLSSETNVIAQKDVTGTDISARGKIIVKGTLRNSSVSADSVSAESIAGSSVVAHQSVSFGRIDIDENNILSTICVGMFDFFRQRIQENEQFLERARENLTRIEMLMGPEIVQQVDSRNIQIVLLRFLSARHLAQDPNMRKQIDVYRKLLESVPPTRALINQKKLENIDLQKRLADKDSAQQGVVVVREKIVGRALFTINGVEAEINSVPDPSTITSDQNANLIIESIDSTDAERSKAEMGGT